MESATGSISVIRLHGSCLASIREHMRRVIFHKHLMMHCCIRASRRQLDSGEASKRRGQACTALNVVSQYSEELVTTFTLGASKCKNDGRL
eukprot:scaffold118836_cov15-Tisochrysis_lutea.AAC.1